MKPFYYDDDMNVYKSHYEAIKSKKRCWLYYGDDFYKNVNWKIEPTLSLDQLYKLRAEEIRDTYDHVILCLSGGIDSRTIFETFYKNKIHLDEIICVGAYSQDLYIGSEENNNDEIYNNVKTLLKDYHLPNTKVQYLDYSELFNDINNFSILKTYSNDWIFHLNCWKSIHHFYWADLEKHIIKTNKKSCIIMGEGKTCLRIHDKPYIIFSEDDIMGYFGYDNDTLKRENFYFGITNVGAEIVKKQAFIMYDVYKKMNNPILFFTNYASIYNNIIYKYSLLNKPTRKSTNKFLSIRDKYILRKTDSELYKIYMDGIKKYFNDVGPYSISYATKPYYLE